MSNTLGLDPSVRYEKTKWCCFHTKSMQSSLGQYSSKNQLCFGPWVLGPNFIVKSLSQIYNDFFFQFEICLVWMFVVMVDNGVGILDRNLWLVLI